jgi:hypothetical protein
LPGELVSPESIVQEHLLVVVEPMHWEDVDRSYSEEEARDFAEAAVARLELDGHAVRDARLYTLYGAAHVRRQLRPA